jgi:hypothetical protein
MKPYACYDANGRYVVVGTCESDLTSYDIPDGCSVYYGGVSIITQYHDIATDTPTDKGDPPQPDGYKFDYVDKAWEPDISYLDYKTKSVRSQLLLDSDWTDTLSAKNRLGQTLYDQWQTYRQALRDITAQPGYPIDIVWPTLPTA